MSALRAAAATLVALSAYASAANPQALADPTRPPNALTSGPAQAADAPGYRLQSILISPQRRLAVIDGRTVALGESINEATLVQVAETYVKLKQGNELKTLELYPDIGNGTREQRESRKKGMTR